MKWIILGCIVVLLFIGIVYFLADQLARYVAHPAYVTLEQAKEAVMKAGVWEEYDRMPKEAYKIEAADGYQLQAYVIPAEVKSNKYVVISHGYSYNRYGSVKYTLLFHLLDYHCIIYDNRGHGNNESSICTMGVQESRDLISVIQDTYRRYGEDIYLGLHGESMGAALQIMSLAYRPRVHFIINDCGYGELIKVLRHKAKQLFHLPGWICNVSSLVSTKIYGYSFQKVRPIDALKDNEIPICFMHGKDDNFISCDHSIAMEKQTEGYSEIHLFPGADHAQSIDSDPNRYKEIVEKFLKKVEELEGKSQREPEHNGAKVI